MNEDSKSTNERGPFLVGSLGLSCRYKIFLFGNGCSSRPSIYKIFFPHGYTISILCPHRPWQAAVLGRLSLRGIPINVPVVYIYMAQDVLILMWENPFRGQLEGGGGGLKIETFFGPEMAASEGGTK